MVRRNETARITEGKKLYGILLKRPQATSNQNIDTSALRDIGNFGVA